MPACTMRSCHGTQSDIVLFVVAALALAACTSDRDVAAFPAIRIAPATLVSAARSEWEHTEYLADAHPDSAGTVVVCSMLYAPQRAQKVVGLYRSADGGATWELSVVDSTARFAGGVADPTCVFGPAGTLYFGTLPPGRVHLYRSADGGRTWEAPLELPELDYPKLLVDRSRADARVYLHGNPGWEEMSLWYSADGARTFAQSQRRVLDGMWAESVGQGAVLPDGTVLLPYLVHRSDTPIEGAMLSIAQSKDGGATLSEPRGVAIFRKCPPGGGATVAMVTADHSTAPFRGRAYVVWTGRHRGHCSVMLAWSDDQGNTWSEPVRVSDERPRADTTQGPDLSLPSIAVNRHGVVGVSWYDRRADPANRDTELRFSASLDGGESWEPSVTVSSQRFVFGASPAIPISAAVRPLIDRGTRQRRGFHTSVVPGQRLYEAWNSGMGDYAGITAAADGRFHTFWIANPNGVAQLYSAAVTVDAQVHRFGSAELSALHDVSAAVQLRYTSTVYDPSSHSVTLGIQLLNIAHDTLRGPLMVRLTRLDSDLGAPLLRSVAGGTRSAPVIDLSGDLPAAGLAPGDTTRTRSLRFAFEPFEGPLRGLHARDVIRFDARVLARRLER